MEAWACPERDTFVLQTHMGVVLRCVCVFGRRGGGLLLLNIFLLHTSDSPINWVLCQSIDKQ